MPKYAFSVLALLTTASCSGATEPPSDIERKKLVATAIGELKRRDKFVETSDFDAAKLRSNCCFVFSRKGDLKVSDIDSSTNAAYIVQISWGYDHVALAYFDNNKRVVRFTAV